MNVQSRSLRRFALAPGEGLALRVYDIAILLGTSICLLLVVPGNIFFGITPLLTGLAALFGLACAGLCALSRRGHQLPGTLAALFAALLNIAWFLGGGSQGSVVMWFFVASVLFVIIFRGRTRALVLTSFLANAMLLYWIDLRQPSLIAPPATAGERFVDLVSGFALSALTCVLLVGGVLAAYNREQRRLEEVNRALERSLAEVKTLRGLLPVCAWCQRIRDDAGDWQPMAVYLEERTSMTHGICPACLEKHFDEVGGAPPPGADRP